MVALVAKDMRVARNHFGRDALGHIIEIKQALVGGNLGLKHRLEQQVAQLGFQILHVAPRNRVVDLIGLLDRVGGNCREILFDIPRTSPLGIAQAAHDFEQLLYALRHGVDRVTGFICHRGKVAGHMALCKSQLRC